MSQQSSHHVFDTVTPSPYTHTFKQQSHWYWYSIRKKCITKLFLLSMSVNNLQQLLLQSYKKKTQNNGSKVCCEKYLCSEIRHRIEATFRTKFIEQYTIFACCQHLANPLVLVSIDYIHELLPITFLSGINCFL